jgi:hypothetical protein
MPGPGIQGSNTDFLMCAIAERLFLHRSLPPLNQSGKMKKQSEQTGRERELCHADSKHPAQKACVHRGHVGANGNSSIPSSPIRDFRTGNRRAADSIPSPF